MKRKAKEPVIAFVFGTRPEIIKFSPIIRRLERLKKPYFLIHTGQHYSFEMDRVFFKDLQLPAPQFQLSIRSLGTARHGDHTGRMLAAVEEIILKKKPNVVLVQGDTNSVLAGALAAAKMPEVRLGHVEAGLRSYDRTMPEEINRVISDHVSDYLFVPTHVSKKLLLREGIDAKKIFVTGNTIVDAVLENAAIAYSRTEAHPSLANLPKDYFLMTLHRQENVDDKPRLASILEGVRRITTRFKTPVIFSVHPRALVRLNHFGLKLPPSVRAIKPIGFLDFLKLEQDARLILSDSGGLQEEACILKVPCVTLRTTTERPETVTVGANRVAGFRPNSILRHAEAMLNAPRNWKNPFGDGHSAERILKIINNDAR